MNKRSKIWGERAFCLAILMSVAVLLMSGRFSMASQRENVHHYKLLSTLEYSGDSQFRNEFETVCTVKKQILSDNKTQYCLSTNSENDKKSGDQFTLKDCSFTVDDKTQHLSVTDRDLAFLEKVSNGCARHLRKVTRANLEKTWKQSFDFSTVDNSLPNELRFTLTAMPLRTEAFGELIAVRALSEPFVVEAVNEDGNVGLIQCKVNSVYVFDSEIEEIYLSISVFKAATNVRGFNEVLQHSVATCKVDATGNKVDLAELGKNKNFENFMSKIGVTDSLKVVKDAPLPKWARADGVKAAQMANICAGTSCEGTLDPVATCLPAVRVVDLQSSGSSKLKTTGAPLASSGGRRRGGGWFDWFGWNWTTAGVITGTTLGTIAITGGFRHHRSPDTP